MIDDKRKLWLMISCNIYFTSQKEKSNYATRFLNKLNEEEISFCIDWLKKNKWGIEMNDLEKLEFMDNELGKLKLYCNGQIGLVQKYIDELKKQIKNGRSKIWTVQNLRGSNIVRRV